MAIKAAFIFTSEGADPTIHHSENDTGNVNVCTFAVKNYAVACDLAQQLIEQGFNAIELCGGFGSEGVAMVKKAVGGKIPVGVVRFDFHPGLNFSSGDDVFLSAE